jgi:hypothetical protein
VKCRKQPETPKTPQKKRKVIKRINIYSTVIVINPSKSNNPERLCLNKKVSNSGWKKKTTTGGINSKSMISRVVILVNSTTSYGFYLSARNFQTFHDLLYRPFFLVYRLEVRLALHTVNT